MDERSRTSCKRVNGRQTIKQTVFSVLPRAFFFWYACIAGAFSIPSKQRKHIINESLGASLALVPLPLRMASHSTISLELRRRPSQRWPIFERGGKGGCQNYSFELVACTECSNKTDSVVAAFRWPRRKTMKIYEQRGHTCAAAVLLPAQRIIKVCVGSSC